MTFQYRKVYWKERKKCNEKDYSSLLLICNWKLWSIVYTFVLGKDICPILKLINWSLIFFMEVSSENVNSFVTGHHSNIFIPHVAVNNNNSNYYNNNANICCYNENRSNGNEVIITMLLRMLIMTVMITTGMVMMIIEITTRTNHDDDMMMTIKIKLLMADVIRNW